MKIGDQNIVGVSDVQKHLSNEATADTKGLKGAAYLGKVITNITHMIATKFHRVSHALQSLVSKGEFDWVNNKSVITRLLNDVSVIDKKLNIADFNAGKIDKQQIVDIRTGVDEMRRVCDLLIKSGASKTAVKNVNDQIDGLEKQVKAVDDFLDKNQVLKTQAEEALQNATALENKAAGYQIDVRNATEKIAKALAEVEVKKQEIAQLQAQLSHLRSQPPVSPHSGGKVSDTLQREVAQLKQELATAQQSVQQFQEREDSVLQELREAKSQLADAKKTQVSGEPVDVGALKKKIHELEQASEKVAGEVKAKETEITAKEGTIRDLTSQLQQAQSAVLDAAETEKKLRTAEAEFKKAESLLEKEVEQLKQELATAQQSVQQFQVREDRVLQELQEAKSLLAEAKKPQTSGESVDLGVLKKKIHELEQASKKVGEDVKAQEKEIKAKEETIRDLTLQLQQVKNDVLGAAQTEKKLRTAEAELTKAEAELTKAEGQLEKAKKELQEQEEKTNAAEAKFEESIEVGRRNQLRQELNLPRRNIKAKGDDNLPDLIPTLNKVHKEFLEENARGAKAAENMRLVPLAATLGEGVRSVIESAYKHEGFAKSLGQHQAKFLRSSLSSADNVRLDELKKSDVYELSDSVSPEILENLMGEAKEVIRLITKGFTQSGGKIPDELQDELDSVLEYVRRLKDLKSTPIKKVETPKDFVLPSGGKEKYEVKEKAFNDKLEKFNKKYPAEKLETSHEAPVKSTRMKEYVEPRMAKELGDEVEIDKTFDPRRVNRERKEAVGQQMADLIDTIYAEKGFQRSLGKVWGSNSNENLRLREIQEELKAEAGSLSKEEIQSLLNEATDLIDKGFEQMETEVPDTLSKQMAKIVRDWDGIDKM